MMIAARNAFLMGGAKLPYDAEVEYIESTGTQWVDTGIDFRYPKPNAIAYDCRIQFTTPSTSRELMGANGNGFMGKNASNNLEAAIVAIPATSALSVRDVTFAFSWVGNTTSATVSVDGSVYTNAYAQSVNSDPYRVVIFALGGRNNAAPSFHSHARVFRFAITVNDVLVRDFIPVRVGSGASAVGYLYDRVSGDLFGNAGTGAFVIGPDK